MAIGVCEAAPPAERSWGAARIGRALRGRAVVAVDTRARVLTMNAAARGMLGKGMAEMRGRRIDEAVPRADMRRLMVKALLNATRVTGCVSLDGCPVKLQADAWPFVDGTGRDAGALIRLIELCP